MKRILSLLLLCILLPLLAACDGNSTPESITITSNFVLVIDENADATAAQAPECLQATLDFKMAIPNLKIVHNDPQKNAVVFRVDNTMEEGSYRLTLKNTSIYLTAQNSNLLLDITRQLRQLMLDNNNTPVVTQQMCAQLTGHTDTSNLPFRVLSQNILFKDISGGNTISDRQPRFYSLMQEYCPDILAMQEYSDDWRTYIQQKFGNVYTETAASGLCLLFRTDRYEINDSGHFYMSPTPNIKSQFEGDSGPRSCIWAIVTDKFSNETMLFINCHPDWINDTQRALQVDVIFDVMSEKIRAHPTIFIGDFNTLPDGPVYAQIIQTFKDTNIEAECNLSEVNYTYHNFGEKTDFIDYTFFNGPFMATTYRIISDMYKGHVSDHYGVMTDFCLKQ